MVSRLLRGWCAAAEKAWLRRSPASSRPAHKSALDSPPIEAGLTRIPFLGDNPGARRAWLIRLMGVEKPDCREHSAVVVVGLRKTELRHDAVYVLLDGALGDPEAPADTSIRASLRHQ